MAHLNAAGITRLVTKLKDRFAALSHTHAAATDITGQLPVANGGTGASTASGARTNLDAAQDDTSGTTLAAAASNISTLLATTGIASTPSGKTLQGQISTLQDSVSLGKGTFNTKGLIACGHVSGSGNYAEIFLPYRLRENVTSVSFSYTDNSSIIFYLVDTFMNISSINSSYCKIDAAGNYGFILEFKFSTTQQANRPCAVRFGNGSSITIS